MVVSILKKIGAIFSLNDPKWGKGSGNDNDGNKPNTPHGPPDLEDLWKDFNHKLNAMFGGKGAGGGDGLSPDPNSAKWGAWIIVVILVFLWLVSGSFVVQEGQTGVVMTFGKYSHDTPSGFNWRLPYPIQSHEIVNVSTVRTVEVGYQGNVKNKQPKEALMLTDDENIIDIQFAVQYKLKSASDWIFKNREQESTVKQVAETAIREVVGRNKMDFVLYEGREKVALDVGQLMQKLLDLYQTGVQVTNVTMQGVQPPEQVQAAFDDAVKAGQDRERQKNEGQAYANDVIPKARGAAARLQEQSQAYQAQVIANAEGNASRFKQVLDEYQKAPAVTRDRMYLDTMQQIFMSTTKMMVDTKSGNNLIYLPLDKLIGQTLATDPNASVQKATGTAQDVTNANELLRARDSHGREREGR
ncbi:membrane protease subunit HflK [Oxalobacteraceae bacterium GrIS 2.11]